MHELMKLTLGDWSNDGHGKTETIILRSNKSIRQIREAYKKSCLFTHIRLDHNSDIDIKFPKDDWESINKYTIANHYEDDKLTKFHIEKLAPHGFTLDVLGDEMEEFIDGDDIRLTTDHFKRLWLWFVKLSFRNNDWDVQEVEIDPINGFWNKELNVGFGYGLFV